MSIRILSSSDVEGIISQTDPVEVMDMMAKVFTALSTRPHRISSPHRSTIEMSRHSTLFMPSRVGDAEIGETAIKIVSCPRPGVEGGIPATTIIMDEQTGRTRAIISASSLTALRTAAGSLLATSLLYKNTAPPQNIVCFGAGLQTYYHASLILQYYSSSAKTCTIVNRSDNERLRTLVQKLKVKFPTTEIHSFVWSSPPVTHSELDDAVEKAVREAHIICTATSSTKPLFPSKWVSQNTHLNLVGSYKESMREVELELVARARTVCVDSKEACEQEAGELIDAQRQGVAFEMLEVGKLLEKSGELKDARPGLIDKGEVTIFKSVGVGIQDVAIGFFTLQKAEVLNLGSVVPF